MSQTEDENSLKLDCLCVAKEIQNKHIGRKLLYVIEEYTLSLGKNSIVLEARVTAEPFYRKFNYTSLGQKFMKTYVPVEHILMEKQLVNSR